MYQDSLENGKWKMESGKLKIKLLSAKRDSGTKGSLCNSPAAYVSAYAGHAIMTATGW